MLSSVKSFIIAFAVGILIFGLIGYFVAPGIIEITDNFLTPGKNEEQTGEVVIPEVPDVNSGSLTPVNPDFEGQQSFTLLLIGSDYQPDVFSDYRVSVGAAADIDQLAAKNRHYSAGVMTIVKYSAEQGRIMLTSVPSSLLVTVSGIQMRLGDALEKKGMNYFVNLVSGVVGMPVDYYLYARISLFDEIIDSLGGIKFDVPIDMYYVDEEERIVTPGASRDPIPLVVNGEYVYDEDGDMVTVPAGRPFTINLKKGIQTLTGEQATWVLRYNGFPNGSADRTANCTEFFKSFLDQFAREEYKSRLASAVALINSSNSGQTNMSASDFEEIASTLLSYAKYEKVSVAFPGSSFGTGDAERVSYSRNTVYQVYEEYKLK